MRNFTITFSLTQLMMLAIVVYLVAMFVIICSGKIGIMYSLLKLVLTTIMVFGLIAYVVMSKIGIMHSLLKLVLTTIMVFGLIAYVVMNKMFKDRNDNIILAMRYIVVLIFCKVMREVKLMAKRKMKQRKKKKEQQQQEIEE